MKMEIKFNMDNAAFEDPNTEAARILRAIADKLESGRDGGQVTDYNGNNVGSWDIIE